MDINISRRTLIIPLLEAYGKKGLNNKRIWDGLCHLTGTTIHFEYSSSKFLDNIRCSVLRKWNNSGSLKRFLSNNEKWLDEPLRKEDLPPCLFEQDDVLTDTAVLQPNFIQSSDYTCEIPIDNVCSSVQPVAVDESFLKRKRKETSNKKPYSDLSSSTKKRRNMSFQ